jgi:hypothetical protein
MQKISGVGVVGRPAPNREMPQRGRMRYTIKLNEKGEWFEVGEMTQDGQTCRSFSR